VQGLQQVHSQLQNENAAPSAQAFDTTKTECDVETRRISDAARQLGRLPRHQPPERPATQAAHFVIFSMKAMSSGA
jgi:hypothetical protein